MNILKLAAQILLIYILYRLVVNFVIPAYRSVKRFRQQFHSVQQRMNEQYENQKRQAQNQQNESVPKQEVKPQHEGEYIEFEEVKEK